MSQIPQNVDGVYVVESGQTSIRFLDAYQQFGLKNKLPLLGITVASEDCWKNDRTPRGRLILRDQESSACV